jgi:hypothetical protein
VAVSSGAATFLLTGQARLPGAGARPSEVLTITVQVEPRHWTVVAADCTLPTSVERAFIRRHLVGRSLLEPPDAVIDALTRHYQASNKRPVLAAVRDLFRNASLAAASGAAGPG